MKDKNQNKSIEIVYAKLIPNALLLIVLTEDSILIVIDFKTQQIVMR